MSISYKKTTKYSFAGALCVAFFLLMIVQLHAATKVGELSGFAWSSTIGWVNTYLAEPADGAHGIEIVDTGSALKLRGYAWNDNVGWIKFGNISNCPDGDCDARVNESTNELEGWARACSATMGGMCDDPVASQLVEVNAAGSCESPDYVSENYASYCAAYTIDDDGDILCSGGGGGSCSMTLDYEEGPLQERAVVTSSISAGPCDTPEYILENYSSYCSSLTLDSDSLSCSGGGPSNSCSIIIDFTESEVDGSQTDPDAGGWDGWISLNCSNSGDCATSDYQWSISSGEITGYAWGGDVVGWLYADTIETGLSAPVVEIGVRTAGSADPLTEGSYTMTPGEEIEVEWGSSDTTECFSTSGGNFSTGGATGGTDDTVDEPAAGASETYTVACNGVSGSDSASVVVGYPVSDISIWTEPVLTEQNDTVNIFWDVTGHDPAACTVSGPNGFNFVLASQTGSQASDPIVGETTLTISCAANGVNPATSREVKVRVNASSFDS